MFAMGHAAVQVEQAKQAASSSAFGKLCISLTNPGSSSVMSMGSMRTSGGPFWSPVSVSLMHLQMSSQPVHVFCVLK